METNWGELSSYAPLTFRQSRFLRPLKRQSYRPLMVLLSGIFNLGLQKTDDSFKLVNQRAANAR